MRFTQHARDRLMDRHGTVLTPEEEDVVCAELDAALTGQRTGTAECKVSLRDGAVSFLCVVEFPHAIVKTVLFSERKDGTPRKYREGRQRHLQVIKRAERDWRRKIARR